MAPKGQKPKRALKQKKAKLDKPRRTSSAKDDEEPENMAGQGYPYIYPLVLTYKTQEIFGLRIEEDVTEEKPYKFIKKENIFSDFVNRAAVSDFYPLKKVIQEYPGDELLVVYDKDFKYGRNFYLIGTEEGKEIYLNSLEALEEREEIKEIPEDTYIYKPPVSKPWVSLGSEKELAEESVKESTKQTTFMISRKRCNFGAPVKFKDHNASSVKDGYIECTSYSDRNFVLKTLEKDIGMQVVPKISNTSTQTRWTYPQNAATQYYPREFSEEEKEEVRKSKPLVDFLDSVITSVEIALQQNEIMDTFYDDWKCLAEEEGTFGDKTDTHLKEYQSFTDLHNLIEKMVTCIAWHPVIYGLIAVSVAVRLTCEERIHASGKLLLQPSLILFWSFSDPIHPQLMLESPEDIFCFEFCPSDPNIIAGGCINGQIVLWDITPYAERIENIKTGGSRSKKAVLKPMFLLEPETNTKSIHIRHCAVSSIESGHRKIITDLHWLSDAFELNRMGNVFENRNGVSCQLVTCSADCTICFWDVRSQKTVVPQPTTQPSSQPPQPPEKKKEEIEVSIDVPSTFLHLDLSWKPLTKMRMSKDETTLDHCPTKLTLSKDHYTYKGQAQNKAMKIGDLSLYNNLEVGMTEQFKPIEDFSTKFFVGTEEGEVIYTDWKMERDPETGRFLPKKPAYLYAVHDGTVHTVQRSPFYKDIILTIGGWNLAIWKEGVTAGPLLQSSCSTKRYTSGHWSLTRPGVFYIGREDGYIDIWDLLEKTHQPAHSQNICITSITFIKPWTFSVKQQFIAIADFYGTLHILEIPWTLSHPSTNELSSMNHYFEREVKHLEYVEQRKMIREEEKVQMELENEKKKTKTYKKTKEQLDAELKMDYEEYLELERSILLSLGLSKMQDI